MMLYFLLVPRELINPLVVTANESACGSCLKFCAEHAERCLFCKLSSKGCLSWIGFATRRAKIIINVVYVVSLVSPGGIHPRFIYKAISRFEIDSFVTRREKLTIGARICTREYIICVMRTLRSIIIQIDEPAINERLFALINITYVVYVILYATE